MTIQEAVRSRLSIEPGRRVNTFGGWCRRDRVFLNGFEIGKIQTRRAKDRTEILTIGSAGFVPGHNIEWLISNVGDGFRNHTVNRVERSRQMVERAQVTRRRNAI